MYITSFNVILGDNEKQITIQSCTNTYSENLSLINKYVLNFGGISVNSNTARFYSEKDFIEFVNKLLEF